MVANTPKTKFEDKPFNVVGNTSLVGNRLIINPSVGNNVKSNGGSNGMTSQTINLCVNGVSATMTVLGTAPVAV